MDLPVKESAVRLAFRQSIDKSDVTNFAVVFSQVLNRIFQLGRATLFSSAQ